MMCYKDITFCTFYKECINGKDCVIALTPQVQADAERWWGNGQAPICTYVDKPKCFEKGDK